MDGKSRAELIQSGQLSQCYVRLPFADLRNAQWRLQDLLSEVQYDRDGNDLESRGLYLDVPAWRCHAFTMTRSS
jgi:hypothetical protein